MAGYRVLFRSAVTLATVLDLLDELVSSACAAWAGAASDAGEAGSFGFASGPLVCSTTGCAARASLARLGSAGGSLCWRGHGCVGPCLVRASEHLLQSIHPACRAVASGPLAAWDQAVRASSAVENWHSIVRPHLAVHRKLSAGMLSLLAVWHNHRIAPRGPHEGLAPLQRTEALSSTHHWLAALGYFSLAA